MKIGKVEMIYIPYKKTKYQLAKEEMARLTIQEINTIVGGATFIMLCNLNMLQAKLNVSDFTNRVDEKGNEILSLIQIIGYWAAIIFAGIDIVKAFKKQDLAGITAIAVKYALAVGILYGLPDIFDMIKGLFKGE
ncbi:MAG: hypothetical protein K0S71_639 [Clostridia bacterium]|jgi:hypothetical protein|nr:hypothetical protein [Clostridia bacterium]